MYMNQAMRQPVFDLSTDAMHMINTPIKRFKLAISTNDINAVRELADNGYIHCSGIDGKTPLYLALNEPKPNMEIVRVLCEKGANVNCRTAEYTPLGRAIVRDHREAIYYFANTGRARFSAIDIYGTHALSAWIFYHMNLEKMDTWQYDPEWHFTDFVKYRPPNGLDAQERQTIHEIATLFIEEQTDLATAFSVKECALKDPVTLCIQETKVLEILVRCADLPGEHAANPIVLKDHYLKPQRRAKFQMFIMGRHERVGQESSVKLLVDDVVGLIYRFLICSLP